MSYISDIEINNESIIQSPYTYIQAAGSDNSDGSTEGIHLRWDLKRILGENHLPKGHLAENGTNYSSVAGFNKPDDFVRIYRVPYLNPQPCVVDFTNDHPDELIESGSKRWWKFNKPLTNISSLSDIAQIIISFADISQYDMIRTHINPLTNPIEFITKYAGIIEMGVSDLFCFSASIITELNNPTVQQGTLRLETISDNDNVPAINTLESTPVEENLYISCRKKFNQQGFEAMNQSVIPIIANTAIIKPLNAIENKIFAENIKYVRFDYQNCHPVVIKLETYKGFIEGTNYHSLLNWESKGEFSLSIDDNEVNNRLDNSNINVNGNWPRYFGCTQGGLYTVKTENYQNKWFDNEGIKSGIITYLENSRLATNLTAEIATDSDDSDNSGMLISYLDMLRIVSLDYHLARMMGLGYIDTDGLTGNIGNVKYVYLMVYDTNSSFSQIGSSLNRKHFYMTLPASKMDQRLPVAPVLKPPQYGIIIQGTPNPIELTDPSGYSLYEDIRYIRLYKEDPVHWLTFESFFAHSDEFCEQGFTDPVFYGIKYKTDGEQNWDIPELSSDDNFIGNSGEKEVVPLINNMNPNMPVFTHQEKNEGIHIYSLYSINWFSRPSVLGNEQSTDKTIFPIRNTLLPPFNFAVQLIQKEDPLIFTTQAEQDRLHALGSSDDEILVRLTYDWNHIHNNSYQLADKVQFFFRENEPGMIRGIITGVTDIQGTNKAKVSVGPFDIYSTNPPQTITPAIPSGQSVANYIGSQLIVDEVGYIIDNINTSPNLEFIIEKICETSLLDTNNTNINTPTQNYLAPPVSVLPNNPKYFYVSENLVNNASWGLQLSKEVNITSFSNYEEVVNNSDGTQNIIKAGGIYELASIKEYCDVNQEYPNGIPNSRTGLFKIIFNTYQLQNHPDNDVQYYKGIARILSESGNVMKTLEVVNINNTLSTLEIIARDSSFNVNPDYSIASEYIPIIDNLANPEPNPVVRSNVNINFHPGYRVYITAETGFDRQEILPLIGTNSKSTLMAARSFDVENNISSSLSNPSVILAREISVPVPTGIPMGPLFATRPDFYGKSTWTFDTEVNLDNGRQPFSLVFYRTNEQSLLDKLYKPETVINILLSIEQLSEEQAAFMNDYWHGLVNSELYVNGDNIGSHQVGEYKDYIQLAGINGSFQFPYPDNSGFKLPNPDPNVQIYPFNGNIKPGDIQEELKTAIYTAFIPLTEEPVIYSQLRTGRIASPLKPQIRDNQGRRLSPDDADYWQAPMALKLEGTTNKVRFTDFTLDGSSVNIYFYYAVELSCDMVMSDVQGIFGPVRLINSYPPEAPAIKKITAQLENSVMGTPTAVVFEVNPYLKSENIKKIRIYRAYNPEDAADVRTMDLVETTEVTEENVYIDDFENDDFVPYGESLYYRIEAIRVIKNENNNEEEIPSKQSPMVLASIVDVNNPNPPAISYTAETVLPSLLHNVKLKWDKTAHNATYYLYKMNSSGNWQLVDTIVSNDLSMLYTIGDLQKTDDDGNTIYHRYKITVENSSGLLNLTENEITI